MTAPPGAQFLRCKNQFFFRTPLKNRVIFRMALKPVMIDQGPSSASVIRIVANRDSRTFNLGAAESLAPVEQVMNSDALTGEHLRRPSVGGRASPHQELFIIWNQALRPLAGLQ